MRTFKTLMAATVALVGLSTASWSVEPADHFDDAEAKLYEAGYRQVRLADRDRQLFSAFDADGSEVNIVVDANDGTVLSVAYVHAADE